MRRLACPCRRASPSPPRCCTHYYANERQYPADLKDQVAAGLAEVEEPTGKAFGDRGQSAAGLGALGRAGLDARHDGHGPEPRPQRRRPSRAWPSSPATARFAFDSYRRFIQMYSNVVLGLDHHMFEEILDEHKDRLDVTVDTDADRRGLGGGGRRLQGAPSSASSASPSRRTRSDQLWGAIGAVFASWMNDRAKFYRRMHDIPESWGTAVNVQSMVFGNMGETSATGVAFTRNPSTGENRLYGEFLINAQGEDVVAGIRTPQALTKIAREEMGEKHPRWRRRCPTCSPSSRRSSRGSRATTATCRTSSSRSSRAGSTCCRRATGSARPRRR